MYSVLSTARQNDLFFRKTSLKLLTGYLLKTDSISPSFQLFSNILLNNVPSYLNEVFELACPNNLKTRNSYLKLFCTFRKTNTGQIQTFLGFTSNNTNNF